MLSYLQLNTSKKVIYGFKVSTMIDWLKALCTVLCGSLAWNGTELIWMWLQYCTQNVLGIDFLHSLRELEGECPKEVGEEDEQFNSCHLFPQTYTVPCREKVKRVSCNKLSSEKDLIINSLALMFKLLVFIFSLEHEIPLFHFSFLLGENHKWLLS